MRKILLALTLFNLLISLASCPCNAIIYPFQTVVYDLNSKPILNVLNINQPTKVIIGVPSSYSSSGACGASLITVTNVTFFNNNFMLGEVLNAPFSFEWIITPGQNEIPLNENIQVDIKARDNNGKESDSYIFTIQVSALTLRRNLE